MSEKFDPYHTWLGIPPEEQPAHHYRLLGLRPFEVNSDVISNALDQRLAHLKTLQTGKNSALSQTLLNEVSAAGACLLVPEKKTAYDLALRKQLGTSALPKAKVLPQAASLPQATPIPQAPPATPLATPHIATPSVVTPVSLAIPASPKINSSGKLALKKTSNLPYFAAGIVIVAVVVCAVIIGAAMNGKSARQVAGTPKTANQPLTPQSTTTAAPASTSQKISTEEATNTAADMQPMPLATLSADSSATVPTTTNPVDTPPEAELATPTAVPSVALAPSVQSAAAPAEPTTPSPEPNQATSPATEAEARPDPAPFGSMPQLAAIPDAATEPGNKLPEVPGEEAITAARAQILEIFGNDAKAAVKPEQKATLADTMDDLARDTRDNPTVRFVLMDSARKLYIGAGEVAQALQTTQRLLDAYAFDQQRRQDLLVATSTALADGNLATEQRELLAKQLHDDVETAMNQQQWELADQLSAVRVKVATRLRDVEDRRLANQQRTVVVKAKTEFLEFTKVQTALAADPTNTNANLTAGKFLCSVQRNWKKGRPHLAAAGIDSLKEVLATDEAAEAGAEEADAGDLRLAAGDSWFNWAESAKGVEADLVILAKVRAKYWYRVAADSLVGLNRAKAEKRLKELASVADNDSPSLAAGNAYLAKGAPTSPGMNRTNTTSKTSTAQSWEPGLFGRLFVDNQVQNVLLSYQEGYTITPADTAELLAGRGAGQKVRIELEGFLIVPQDGEYTFNVAGGSASGGVHSFFVAGNKLSEIGDDRTKNDTRTIPLARGEYPLKFLLTGGELGSAKVSVRPADSMGTDSKLPTFGTPKKLAANLRQSVKREVAFGTAVASPIAPANKTPPPPAPTSSKTNKSRVPTPFAMTTASVCETLQGKRPPVGCSSHAEEFKAPIGDGRSGANGLVLAASDTWKRQGSTWKCTYFFNGSANGIKFAHPYQDGHLLVSLNGEKGGFGLNAGGHWSDVGWRMAGQRKLPFELTPEGQALFPLAPDTEYEIVSQLIADGQYGLFINKQLIAYSLIPPGSTQPLDLRIPEAAGQKEGALFSGGSLPRALKAGEALVIVGPLDNGTNRLTKLEFGPKPAE
jgi:hypothetical protein